VQKGSNVLLPQHGWFSPPHAPHEPWAEHVPVVPPQELETPTHTGGENGSVEGTQQLPSVHRLPAQHGVPAGVAVPHFSHRASKDSPAQTASESLHFWLAQQGPPTTPHVWHRLSTSV
jgi:hypothetical protein